MNGSFQSTEFKPLLLEQKVKTFLKKTKHEKVEDALVRCQNGCNQGICLTSGCDAIVEVQQYKEGVHCEACGKNTIMCFQTLAMFVYW